MRETTSCAGLVVLFVVYAALVVGLIWLFGGIFIEEGGEKRRL